MSLSHARSRVVFEVIDDVARCINNNSKKENKSAQRSPHLTRQKMAFRPSDFWSIHRTYALDQQQMGVVRTRTVNDTGGPLNTNSPEVRVFTGR